MTLSIDEIDEDLFQTIKSTSHIKKWILRFPSDEISEKSQERLQELFLERNDNSIYVRDVLESFQSQIFDISPVSVG